jgi:hypothetical protein
MDSLKKKETAQSRKDRDHPNWEPDWIRQRFSALLLCSKCNEPVFLVGSIVTMEDYEEEFGWCFSDALTPSFFEPHTPVIQIPSKCPSVVSAEIIAASRLYWSSPASVANRIRAALERLMDAQGIPKKGKTSKGKFEKLSLHARIERFEKKKPEVGANLLAIKWLGNSGSHSNDLIASDTLDGFELLAHALEEIYESKSVRLKRLAAAIIKKKGPVMYAKKAF